MVRIIIGIILFLVGFFLRVHCVHKLGNNFTFKLLIPSEIVTDGIYKHVRHPSYTGSLIMILGWSLINPVLGIMQLSYAFFLARVAEEERKLEIYEEYVKYKQDTGTFLPKVRSDHGR